MRLSSIYRRRELLWLPLGLYGLLAIAYLAQGNSRGETLLRFLVELLGSFLLYFYISYLALWKGRRTPARRVLLASVLPLAPLALLVLFDLTGVELATVPLSHGFPVFNTMFWFVPGMTIADQLNLAIDHRKPPEPIIPEQAYVRGGMPREDGSLILYGGTTNRSNDFETFRLLARLDAAGNVDPAFAPVAVETNWLLNAEPFTQPDGTTLLDYLDWHYRHPAILQLFPNGSTRVAVQVLDYDGNTPKLKFGPKGAGPPVQLLPGWLSINPKLIRVRPDGKLDEAFNAQAAKVMGQQDLGDYRLAAFDSQGRVVVGFWHGILRLDAEGRLLAPGAVALEKGLNLEGLAVQPNGSVLVTLGAGFNEAVSPRLLRFDDQLQQDRVFSDAATSLATPGAQFFVLGSRKDGGAVVSLVQKLHGSRIFFLGPKGQLAREVHLDYGRSP
jgi:hypothetical protein